MAYFLLIVHIATAIVFIGALTISVSLFPRYAAPASDVNDKSHDTHPVALAMHRITKVYGRLAIIPPAVGITLAVVLGRLDELWIILSVALSLIGGALLTWVIIPAQRRMLADPRHEPSTRRRAGAAAGILNSIWFAILILMILKPGAGG
ncbi:MAG: hypothetical protein BGN97_09800 [Microbacterium sp. 69-10]|uniref:DUF2269 family protein n=1 Tax=Microbacterium sp. 69-10 TaxID=1895783 RepID=UPI00095EB3E0|nr:DUF2269 family protein [Microbacterium sp. 69-10]OJU41466.1 MAG: hypothetical protein BGN97_09800 [Microbacterium sp. 69-10]